MSRTNSFGIDGSIVYEVDTARSPMATTGVQRPAKLGEVGEARKYANDTSRGCREP